MNFIIEEIPSYRTAYIRRTGAYGATNLKVMEDLKIWSKMHGLYNESSIIFAVIHDNPQVIKEADCRYDACIVIPENYALNDPDNVNDGKIDGGKYAIFQVTHTVEGLQRAWIEILPALQKESISIDMNRPVVECYKIKMVHNHLCEICVPIK